MDGLFASGRIVDLILVGVAVEAMILLVLCRSAGRFAPFGATIAAGAALMLALRAALTGSPWPVVAGWMLAGLIAHVADLVLRRKALRPAILRNEARVEDAWPQGPA